MPCHCLRPVRSGLFQQLTELRLRGSYGPLLHVFHIIALQNQTNMTILVIYGHAVNGECTASTAALNTHNGEGYLSQPTASISANGELLSRLRLRIFQIHIFVGGPRRVGHEFFHG